MYKLIAIAGTFDRLHIGHKYFISEAFKQGEKVIIGLTSDSFIKEKIKNQKSKIKINVKNFEERKRELEEFLQEEGLLDRAEIVKIYDIYGPAIVDKEIEALIVTTETLEGANQVNKKRKELGLKQLKVFKVDLILAQDQERIASTRIRLGEINRWGRVFNQIFNFQFSIFKIPEELRQELKKPLGILIEGDPDNLLSIAKKLKEAVEKTNLVLISTVGDEVTKICNEIGIALNLSIFDYRVGRKEKYQSLSDLGFKLAFARGPLENGLLTVKNPAGHITNELVDAVKSAYLSIIKNGKQRVIQVDGEEDLAGVPAILLAPLGTLVLYGQPGEGVVMVEVTEEKKQELIDLINNNI